MLEEVRAVADVVVDTLGDDRPRAGARSYQKTFVGDPDSAGMVVSATSFGYKFGTADDVDLLFDVRSSLNPHFVPELKGKTGADPAVAAYIEKDPETSVFPRAARVVPRLSAAAVRETRGRATSRSASAARGASTRSVYIAERLAEASQGEGISGPRVPTGTRPANEIMAPLP
jgi:UPF0042 nucleotide-binding protein